MKNAFTLIELLVVMVIAAVIMAVALPGFMSMNRGAAMRGATRSIKSTVALSRQWAITHREVVSVQLSPSNTLLVVDTDGKQINEPLVFVREIGIGFFYGIQQPDESIIWYETTNAIDFTTTGGLKEENWRKITLTETNGATVVENTVLINWLTGGIAVQ